MGMAIRLLQEGKTDFVVLERADDVGGTWQANRYPGCQCDIPSHLYSFSFAPNPDWSRTYSKQQEIWDYMRRVAEDYGVMPYIRLNHEVTGAELGRGRAALADRDQPGRDHRATSWWRDRAACRSPSIPSIPGLDSFEGPAFHTAEWHDDHDLTGERVAVIGTGASSVQVVPNIQPQVGRREGVHAHPALGRARTATGRSPRLERRLYRRVPAAQKFVRSMVYWMHEAMVFGLVHKPAPAEAPREGGHGKHMRVAGSGPRAAPPAHAPTTGSAASASCPPTSSIPRCQETNVDLVTDGDPRDPGRRDRDRGRRAPRGATPSSSGPASAPPTSRRRSGSAAVTGPRSRSAGARARGPTSAWPWPASPTCSS